MPTGGGGGRLGALPERHRTPQALQSVGHTEGPLRHIGVRVVPQLSHWRSVGACEAECDAEDEVEGRGGALADATAAASARRAGAALLALVGLLRGLRVGAAASAPVAARDACEVHASAAALVPIGCGRRSAHQRSAQPAS